MEYVHRSNYFKNVPLQECYDHIVEKPISTRWVDIDKADPVHPGSRARIVAGETKAQDVHREHPFAATPPLEATPMVTSSGMTGGFGFNSNPYREMKLELMDLKSACKQVKARHDIQFDLPLEDY